MANHPSAEKRNRQRIKRAAHNRAIRTAVRTAVRKARVAIETGNENAAVLAKAASVAVAKAAQKGVVPRPTASRTVSRLALSLNRAASGSNG
ncbi:MAG: 30S ribosomal protein S20 [Polyangiaceae bacterium]|nr:30S ribosomal protein S20 [Polyangiaceae bacterium]